MLRRRTDFPGKMALEAAYGCIHEEKDIPVEIIKNLEPDLIIISGDNLTEDCRKIRALACGMRPIIISMSKSAELDDKLRALSAGADDFISEPVNPEEFKARIQAHLRREYESNLDKKLLPNENCSVRALKRIVAQDTNWSCLLVSIEHFQDYKEIYTELASDRLLQTYSAIIRSALSESDYFGSFGENAFLIITDNIKAERLANYLVFTFDAVVPKFYSQQDQARGFVIMQGDEFAGRRSNFVHTSIGIVDNELAGYDKVQTLISDLVQTHRLAKNMKRSGYMIKRPHISGEVTDAPNKRVMVIEEDKALETLLTTILQLQGYEIVTDAPAVVILDAGDDFKELDRIKDFDAKTIVTSVVHDKERILSAGADLYLPKPYELSYLMQWVEKLIAQD